MITTYHNISFGTQTVPEQIPVVQGDTGREIVFILTDFTIPEGATATYYVQKPSGEAVYNSATISENNIIVPLTAQSIIEVGENDLQVRVILDDDIVTSFRAILMVRPFLGIGAVESSTEINIFDQAVEAAKEEINATIESAETALDEAVEEAIIEVHENALAFYVTDTASGAIATFPDGADLVPVKQLTVEIEPVQSGSGDPSPTNVRPITGHTQAVVVDAQRYVLLRPDAPQTYTEHGVAWDASRYPFITAKGTASGGTSYSGTIGGRSQDNSLTAGTYTFKVVGDIDNANIIFQVGSGTGQALNKTTKEITVTVSEDTSFSWYCNVSNNTAVDAKFAFVIGDTNVYEIDLDGTRYGGTLDVVTGVLTVDRAYATITSFQGKSGATTNNLFYVASYASTIKKPSADSEICEGFISDKFMTRRFTGADSLQPNSVTGIAVNTGGSIYVGFGLDGISTLSDANTWAAANPIQIVYPLATPQTVQLTAEQVTTLLGQNCIFADCGNVAVAYRADTRLYIDKLLNA